MKRGGNAVTGKDVVPLPALSTTMPRPARPGHPLNRRAIGDRLSARREPRPPARLWVADWGHVSGKTRDCSIRVSFDGVVECRGWGPRRDSIDKRAFPLNS